MRDHSMPKLKATGNSVVVLQAQGDTGELTLAAVVSGFDNDKDADTFGSEWVQEQHTRTGQETENGKPLFGYTVYEEVELVAVKATTHSKK